MGIFSSMNGVAGKSGSTNTGEHGIDQNVALAPTDAKAITPNNPGTFKSIRSFPVCSDPRYFTANEAEALSKLAVEKTANAYNAKKAFKDMSRIETADTIVHTAHKEYLGNVAVTEAAKVKASGKLAEQLHRIRPAYAQMHEGIQTAQQQANLSIARRTGRILEIKTK